MHLCEDFKGIFLLEETEQLNRFLNSKLNFKINNKKRDIEYKY